MTLGLRPPVSASAANARRRSRGLLVVGAGLILASLSVLGWLGWEFWGTNWVSHRTF